MRARDIICVQIDSLARVEFITRERDVPTVSPLRGLTARW
jgi:hypothetical protein